MILRWLALSVMVALLAVPSPAQAQRRDYKQLKNNYKKLLAKEFMQRAEWHESLKKAMKAGKEKQLPVLAYFTRSDKAWPPCEEIENESLISKWFLDATERFVLYINVQTGGLNLPEEAMIDKIVGKNAMVPWFVLLDGQGKAVERFRMNEPEELERALGATEELLDARRAVKENKKDKAAKARLALLEGMRSEKPNINKLTAAARTKGLDEDILERFRNFAAAIPVAKLFAEMSRQLSSASESGSIGEFPKIRGKYAEELYDLHIRKKLEISDRGSEYHAKFWSMLCEGGVRKKDRAVAQRAFDIYDKSYRLKEKHKKKLKELREMIQSM